MEEYCTNILPGPLKPLIAWAFDSLIKGWFVPSLEIMPSQSWIIGLPNITSKKIM